MSQQLIRTTEDLRGFARHKVILPGDPEPEWLRRNASYARILEEEAVEQKIERLRSREKRPNFVARLILRRA